MESLLHESWINFSNRKCIPKKTVAQLNSVVVIWVLDTQNNEKSFRLIIHSSMEKYLAAKHLHNHFSGWNFVNVHKLIFDAFKIKKKL